MLYAALMTTSHYKSLTIGDPQDCCCHVIKLRAVRQEDSVTNSSEERWEEQEWLIQLKDLEERNRKYPICRIILCSKMRRYYKTPQNIHRSNTAFITIYGKKNRQRNNNIPCNVYLRIQYLPYCLRSLLYKERALVRMILITNQT